MVLLLQAGVILGPSILGRNKTYMEIMFAPKEMVVLATMSNMAVYLYMFVVCIKMDAIMLTKAAKHTWKLGFCCLVFPVIFTIAVTIGQHYFLHGAGGSVFPIQFTIMSPISYFIVITRALDELNLLSSEVGQISLAVAMHNEVVSGTFQILGVALGQQDVKTSVYAVLSLCSLIMFAFFVIRPMLYWIVKITPKGKPVKECYVIAILLLLFLMGLTTDAIGASFGMASVIMGFVIPDGWPLGTTIIRTCELILFELFLPLFFVRIGYFTNLSAIKNWDELMMYGTMTIAGCLGRLVACLLVSSSMKLSKRSAVLLSLILSLQGVVELIQSIRWKHLQVRTLSTMFIENFISYKLQLARIFLQLLTEQTYATSIMGIVVLNSIITPIIEMLYKPAVMKKLDSPTLVGLRIRSLRMTSTVEELRIITCIQDEEVVPIIIRLLEALNPKEISPISAYVIHLVPVASQSVPTLAPYKNHLRKFNQPSGSDNIIRAFLNYVNKSQGLVQIHPFRMISHYKYMHEPICRLSEKIHAPVIVMPFFNSEEAHSIDGTLRIFNTNVQASATCTVGLLVDRGLCSSARLTPFSYTMAVIFLGGVDDREALALATRASCHPNVMLTILRIDVGGSCTMDAQMEKEVDNTLFKDFKDMNINNGRVVYHEFAAHDVQDIMSALRCLTDPYDLVVVGKRHGVPELQTMLCWVQYPELGVIGDAIAAPDFVGGRLSVLVLQHHSEENQ